MNKKDKEAVVVTDNQKIIVCWHPQVPIEYNLTKVSDDFVILPERTLQASKHSSSLILFLGEKRFVACNKQSHARIGQLVKKII